MNRKVSLVALLVVILMGASLLPFLPGIGAEGEGEGEAKPLADDYYGDYYVYSGDEDYITGESWNMYGSIYVYWILHISETSLFFGGADDGYGDGELGIYVYSGAELYVDKCNFTAKDQTTPVSRPGIVAWNHWWGTCWHFQIFGKANITNSDLSYMWGDGGSSLGNFDGGIQCYSNDIYIYNCYLYNNENAGISTISDPSGSSTTGGFDPVVDKCVISNSSGWGIAAGGSGAQPKVTNTTIIGSGYRGGQYFYGATGIIDQCKFLNTKREFGFTFDPIVSGTMTITNTTFSGNRDGYSSRRTGTINLVNCHLDNNRRWGLELAHDTGASYMQTVYMTGGTANGNGMHGVSTNLTPTTATLQNVEIANNKVNGVNVIDPSNTVDLMNCRIFDNKNVGVKYDKTVGSIKNCEISRNTVGNILILNATNIPVQQNTINGPSPYGIRPVACQPAIVGNSFIRNDIGLLLEDGATPGTVSGNTYDNNRVGVMVQADAIIMSSETFTKNTQAGISLEDVEGFDLSGATFTNDIVAISVSGGGFMTLGGMAISGATGAAISATNRANISVMGCDMSGNTRDFKLDIESQCRVYSVGSPSNKVQIMDSRSEFWHFWNVAVNAHDNQTLFPVSNANMMVYGSAGELLLSQKTFFDGSASGDVLEYYIRGSQTTYFTPVNITVSKVGYIPYWGGFEPLDQDIYREINLSINKAPEFPEPWEYSPDETHNNRPTLRWNASTDWNLDIINYKVNVYQDELYSSNHVVIDAINRLPQYTFTKNLRYNKEYFVEIETYDPWGLNDTRVFSFRTINTKPTTPILAFEMSPVSSKDDIVVLVKVNASDVDVDPIDDISYLVEWEVFRSGSWVLVSSGIDAFMLSSNETNEGDRIRVRVKAFDGIEYGQEVSMEVLVLNFAPKLLDESVDLTINEDEIALNLVSLDEFFFDQDLDDLTYSIFFQRHVLAEIEPVSNNLTLTPLPDWFGTDYILVEALDGKHSSEDLSKLRINITVKGINDAPVITLLNEKPVRPGIPVTVQFQQGSWAVVALSTFDADEIYGDNKFTFSTDFREVVGNDVVKAEDLQFQTKTGAFKVFLTNPLVGEHTFNITVTDGNEASSSALVHLIVENINEAPTKPAFKLPEGDTAEIDEGDTISFTIDEADDPDLHIPNSKERIYYDWTFGELDTNLQEIWIRDQGTSVEHQFINSGPYTIKVRARDSLGQTAESEKKMTITVNKEIIETPETKDDKPFLQEYGMILILVLVVLLVIILLVFIFTRKEPLAEVADKQEKEHEELVAKQQQDALAAQEKLQALLGGVAMAGATGPALPAAPDGSGLQALPAATMPEGASPEPALDTVPFQAPPVPESQPVAAPGPIVGQVPESQPPMAPDQTYLPPPTQ
jgi:hypothetical protein